MVQITVPARADRLYDVLAFIEESFMNTGMDLKSKNNVKIAVEEIFINIANYAYPSGNGDVAVSVSVDAKKFIICFKDNGVPFDPLAASDPDIALPADERDAGGLGIFMVKNMMDDVEYCYENKQNILTVSKEFKKSI